MKYFGGMQKLKNAKRYIITGIGSIIFIITAYLPNDRYVLKIIGLVILNLIIWRDNIRRFLFKHIPKDNKPEK
ncbi:hypothetical protein [Clostridium sp. KNHs216]|uniref:hypothetical protein n=1 Tax=Clostridium sp. KNHs216 TaxID=1550235 RepID=UPI00114F31FF|nr:hypothetical protein [Clostridium sp. KNHs216]TQI67546.1 hypothetical protein LY85_2238 [Clostridium sp. KNHs216]